MTTQLQSNATWEVDCPPEYRFGMDGTKWRIFCCAVHYFAEYDYSSMSMRKIARQVGIQAASIYNHFPSKDAILDKMYACLGEAVLNSLPDLDELLVLAETEPPHQVLKMIRQYYPEPQRQLLSKMILSGIKMMRSDTRADKQMRSILIDIPFRHISTLLEHMITLGRIEPLDIEAFAELFINNYYGAAARISSSHAVEDHIWQRSFVMLFSVVTPVSE